MPNHCWHRCFILFKTGSLKVKTTFGSCISILAMGALRQHAAMKCTKQSCRLFHELQKKAKHQFLFNSGTACKLPWGFWHHSMSVIPSIYFCIGLIAVILNITMFGGSFRHLHHLGHLPPHLSKPAQVHGFDLDHPAISRCPAAHTSAPSGRIVASGIMSLTVTCSLHRQIEKYISNWFLSSLSLSFFGNIISSPTKEYLPKFLWVLTSWRGRLLLSLNSLDPALHIIRFYWRHDSTLEHHESIIASTIKTSTLRTPNHVLNILIKQWETDSMLSGSYEHMSPNGSLVVFW